MFRKNLKKPRTRFELCHNRAHRFLGNQAQTLENIFAQTAHFNSQQLVAENIITRLAHLLGKITVRQICERFEGTNLGKRVEYEIMLPGCPSWIIEVKAENAHIAPHLTWTESHLKLIAEELQKSTFPQIQTAGETLLKELKKKHQEKKFSLLQEFRTFSLASGEHAPH